MVNRNSKFSSQIFAVAYSRNLSMDVFSEVALKNFVEISNFQLKTKKRFQPTSNHCPPPPRLPSNYTAVP